MAGLGSFGRAFIILFLVAGLAAPQSWASPNNHAADSAIENNPSPGKGRIAADLKELLKSQEASGNVKVVVNLNAWGHADDITAKVTALGGQVRAGFKNVRQMVVEMPAGSVERLTEISGIEYLAPDRPVTSLASHPGVTTGASQVYPPSFDTPLSAFLIGGGLVGYDGTGVGVAVIDSGIYPDHFDLRENGRKNRVALAVDFVGSGASDDPFGHGTHIAGIIAGNGYSSFQTGQDFTGMAPGAHLVSLRVLDDHGRGRISGVIAALDFAIANRQGYNIRVVNMSLAAPPVDSFRDDPLCQAVGRAAAVGLVVTASAGNFGVDPYGNHVYGGITSPGLCPSVITVGAVATRGTNARSDDRVAVYSSRGPTRPYGVDPVTGETVRDNLAKPDLVAPGSGLVSLERPDNTLVRYFPHLHFAIRGENNRNRYMTLSGTSMSTAVVSGAVALLLQANPSLPPNLVKAILMYSAQILEDEDLFEQGAGLLNVEGAMRIARALRKDLGTRQVGQTLTQTPLPRPSSTIAGQDVAWSQGLIWGNALVDGPAAITRQQEIYTQGLIWGFGLWRVWGAGVVYSDGLYSGDHVVYGRGGRWQGVTWDYGSRMENGVLFRDDLAAGGVAWANSLMIDDFYSLSPSSLIWGRMAYDVGLIWGLDRFLYGMGLIWGFGGSML